MFTKKVMQFHSKQIGTPPGDHNKPGGPANMKGHMTQRIHKATNPFSKQSEMLTAEEYAMWKAVMKANETADPNNGDDPTWDIVRKGITWFQKHNIKAYMTLLD